MRAMRCVVSSPTTVRGRMRGRLTALVAAAAGLGGLAALPGAAQAGVSGYWGCSWGVVGTGDIHNSFSGYGWEPIIGNEMRVYSDGYGCGSPPICTVCNAFIYQVDYGTKTLFRRVSHTGIASIWVPNDPQTSYAGCRYDGAIPGFFIPNVRALCLRWIP